MQEIEQALKAGSDRTAARRSEGGVGPSRWGRAGAPSGVKRWEKCRAKDAWRFCRDSSACGESVVVSRPASNLPASNLPASNLLESNLQAFKKTICKSSRA